MHVLPTAADLRTADEKCDPMEGFVPLEPTSNKWEHHAKFCNDCNEPFDLVFVRKHHCRNCGLTFCSRCAPPRHLLTQARGCMKCTRDLLVKMKDDLLLKHVKKTAATTSAGSPTAEQKAPQPAAEVPPAAQPTTTTTTAVVAPPAEEKKQEEEEPGLEKLDVASSVDSDVDEEEPAPQKQE